MREDAVETNCKPYCQILGEVLMAGVIQEHGKSQALYERPLVVWFVQWDCLSVPMQRCFGRRYHAFVSAISTVLGLVRDGSPP